MCEGQKERCVIVREREGLERIRQKENEREKERKYLVRKREGVNEQEGDEIWKCVIVIKERERGGRESEWQRSREDKKK